MPKSKKKLRAEADALLMQRHGKAEWCGLPWRDSSSYAQGSKAPPHSWFAQANGGKMQVWAHRNIQGKPETLYSAKLTMSLGSKGRVTVEGTFYASNDTTVTEALEKGCALVRDLLHDTKTKIRITR